MHRTHAFSSSEVIDYSKSKNVLISCETCEACSCLRANDHDSSSSDDSNNDAHEDDEQNVLLIVFYGATFTFLCF